MRGRQHIEQAVQLFFIAVSQQPIDLPDILPLGRISLLHIED